MTESMPDSVVPSEKRTILFALSSNDEISGLKWIELASSLDKALGTDFEDGSFSETNT